MAWNNLDKYLSIRGEMKSGDAIQWRGNSLLGWAIRLWSKEVNHTSLVIDLSLYKEMGNRRWVLEAEAEGIDFNLLSLRLRHFDGEVWWLPIRPEFYKYRDIVAAWAFDKKGTKYDYGSLFKNMFGKVSAEANKLFCSEFFYLAWKNATGNDFGMRKAPLPCDIPKMGMFKDPIQIL
jgi:hypothetical protein